jgi:cysteine desulfurase
VRVRELGVDLYSMSGHKLYAPKGVGALYLREGLSLTPLQFGGRHEAARRAGTENVPGIAALGAAAEWQNRNGAAEGARVAALRDRLESALLARIPRARVNGAGAPRTPNTTNISFPGADGEAMLIALDLAGFAVSTGAACSSGAIKASHVLTAMGISGEAARGSLRISLGRGIEQPQVDEFVEALAKVVERLRALAPAATHG